MAGKKDLTNFASHLREMPITGVLVQLVRMPACHAGGHGFESRTHRGNLQIRLKVFLLISLEWFFRTTPFLLTVHSRAEPIKRLSRN